MREQAPRLSWGHVNVNVSHLERSVAFYEKLGFEVLIPGIPYLGLSANAETSEIPGASAKALGLDPGTGGRACIMRLGQGFPMLDLTELPDISSRTPPENSDLGWVRVCLASRDLSNDYSELKALGVPFISEPQTAKDGLAEIAVCSDPDGTLIELIQLHLDKWPSPGQS
jgi:catechol 2,3-dioxygenase-like lactoylglutathione lyase family enzyme